MTHVNLYSTFSMGKILLWPTLIIIISISVGSRELLQPTIIGLFSVVVNIIISNHEISEPFTNMYVT